MYRIRSSRLLPLSLAAALCLSLTACKPNQEPEQSSSSVADPPAQSTVAPSSSQQEETPLDEILEVLAQKGLEEYEHVTDRLVLDDLVTHTVDNRSLVVLRQEGLPHAEGLNNLLIGVWDEEAKDTVGEVLILRGDDGLRSSWEDQDGLFHVLLANTTTYQGYEGGSAVKYFTFDGETLTQVTEVPEGYLYEGESLPEGWKDAILSDDADFWTDLKAVPYPGGMELYTRNPEFDITNQTPRQWLYLGYLALDGVPLPLK